MVNRCYNPECKKELRYLRDGRIVRIVHDEGDNIWVEHFWLCGDCSRTYEFVFGSSGSVTMRSIEKPAITAA